MASTTRNIFTLGEYNDDTLAGEGVPMPSVWYGDTRFIDGISKTVNTGYAVGGEPYPGPGTRSWCDKVDMSTDTFTASPSGRTLTPMLEVASTASLEKGYYSGYQNSRVYNLTFSNETTQASPAIFLTISPGPGSNDWSQRATTGTKDLSYWSGGDAGTSSSQTDKLTFATDSFERLPSGNLSTQRRYMTATGNRTQGYFVGGYGPSDSSKSQKMTYSTDTMSLTENYGDNRYLIASMSSSTHGYFTGGASPAISSTNKLDYTTDTYTRIPGLDEAPGPGTFGRGSASNTTTHGYWISGSWSNPAPGPSGTKSWVDKVDFATDTVQRKFTNIVNGGRKIGDGGFSARGNNNEAFDPPTPTPTDTTPRQEAKGGVPNFGYWGTGWYDNNANKLNYATETVSSLGGLSKDTADAAVISSDTTWYQTGGYSHPSSPARWSGTDKIVYATDTVTTNFQNMPSARNTPSPNHYGSIDMTGFSYPAGGKGYFSGGRDGWYGGRSFTTKFTYSSETYSDMPSSNVLNGFSKAYGRSSTTAGYRGGGQEPGVTSLLSKLTFSNETWSQVPNAKISTDGSQPLSGASAGNMNIALFAGSDTNGPGESSMTNKINYATETVSKGGDMTRAEGEFAASGNVTNAFLAGGDHSSYMKYTYATDTASESPANMTFTTKNNTAGSAQDDTNGMVSIPYVV